AKTGVDDLSAAKTGVSDLSGALGTSVNALGTAIDTSKTSLGSLNDRVDELFSAVDKQAGDTSAAINNLAGNVRTEATAYATTRGRLQELLDKSDNLGPVAKSAVQAFINRIGAVADDLNQTADRLTTAANDVDSKVGSSKETRQEIKDLAGKAQSSVSSISKDFDETIKP
ncbi:YhgE/Pip domain-containing protein, partial [Bifidobacterium animalis subsp. lactis]